MKTTPIAKPGTVVQSTNSTPQTDARARAIALLTSQQSVAPEAPPVQGQSAPIPVNANNISVEELSAVTGQSGHNEQTNQADSQEEVVETQQASETPIEESKPVEPPAHSQLAIIARKERALRAKIQQQEQAIKAREEALKSREAAISAKDQEYQSGYISRQRIKEDLLGVMAEEGLSYDELTQQLINQQPENPRVKAAINKLEAQNRALEEKLAAFEKNNQDAQSTAYNQALKQIELDAKALVKSDPDAFEMIERTRSIKDVVDLIETTFKEEGRVMTVEEAAQEVEDYLAEEAFKLSEAKKIQKRRQQVSTTKAPVQTQTPNTPKQPQPMKTLTNATSSSRQLSSKERAILAFQGRLKG